MNATSYSQLRDAEILELLKASDHAAYGEIYLRYFQLIFTHAYKKLRDKDQAEDVVQDVFANLWYNRASQNIASNIAGYLFTSVRNRIFDLFAREEVKGRYLESLGNYLDTQTTPSADYQVRERQMQDYIDRQILELPPKMRRIFQMRSEGHLTHREIAEQIGTTEGNVAKQVTNALRILRTKLSILISILIALGIIAWFIKYSPNNMPFATMAGLITGLGISGAGGFAR